MNLMLQIQAAFSNLFASKLRSLLALLGILVGTASVVAMVSGGQMATMQALKQFQQLGTNLLTLSSNYIGKKTDTTDPTTQISLGTAIKITQASKDIQLAAPYTNNYSQVLFQDQPFGVNIIGAEQNLATILKLALSQGRFVSLIDRNEFYCVLGNEIYKKIEAQMPNPIGKQLKIGDDFFTIVGVLNNWDQNSFVYADLNNAIIVPIQTSLLLSKYTQLNTIIMQINPKADTELLKRSITSYINNHSEDQQLYFNTPQTLIKSMEKQKQIFTIFLGFIGGISLLVGGIGVMNIMLVSVMERRHEIGIRLAVGATPRDISMLFLVESVILALFGGLLGVMLGIFVSFIIAETRHWGFAFFLDPPLIGFTVSVFVGIFFGFYPAYKASKLNPIDALRTE